MLDAFCLGRLLLFLMYAAAIVQAGPTPVQYQNV